MRMRMRVMPTTHKRSWCVQTAKGCGGLTIHGFELNPTSAALAQANAEACNLDSTYQVRRGDNLLTCCCCCCCCC